MSLELRRFYEELAKFVGFGLPGDIRNTVADALNPATEAKSTLPLKTSKAPIVLAFQAVVQNKKCIKQSGPLVNAMCDFVLSGEVQEDALCAVLRSIKFFSEESESDVVLLKNLQFCAAILPKNFDNVEVLRMIFSFSLSLCVHPVLIVSSTAFATSQQMISLFVNFIDSDSNGKLPEVERAKLTPFVKFQFTKDLDSVAFLLLYDICSMIFGRQMTWLDVPQLPAPTLFRLWEMIIRSHRNFISRETKFLDILESSVVMPIVHNDELPFLATFITNYMDVLPNTSMSIFSYFLGSCNVNNPKFAQSLMFFRGAFFRNPNFVTEFYNACNSDGSLIGALLESLDEFIDEYVRKAVTFDMAPLKEDAELDQKFLAETAPVEIVLQIIKTLAKDASLEQVAPLPKSVSIESKSELEELEVKPKETRRRSSSGRRSTSSSIEDIDISLTKYGKLVELTWPKLFTIMVKAMRYASAKSIDMVFEVFEDLVKIVVANGMSEFRAILLRILCGLVAKQRIAREDPIDLEILSNTLLHKNKNGLYFKAKRARAYKLMLSLLYNTPHIFNRLYLRLFMTLSVFPQAEIDSNFTTNLSIPDLTKFCSSLVKGNAFCIDFLSETLIKNEEKFELVFKSIEVPLSKHFNNPETMASAYALVVNVSTVVLNESNEGIFMRLICGLLSRQEMAIEHRVALLNQLRYILVNKSSLISTGWAHIPKTISIKDKEMNDEIVMISFNLLNALCNDHMAKMSPENVKMVVNLIFEFGYQKIDINISLSSFDLLWVIIPIMDKNLDSWELILSQTVVFLSDSRTDVAICALRTFFSLLTSNAKQLPPEIYSHLVTNCFIPQLIAMDQFPKESWTVEQLTLQEMCHCAISFWSSFKDVPEFEASFWPLLIEKQEQFFRHCNDQEINTDALLFYELSFSFDKLGAQTRTILLSSFASVLDHLIRTEPASSLVLASIGKYIQKIIPSQKTVLDESSLKVWLNILSQMCKELPSTVYINLSALKAVECMLALLPLSPPMTRMMNKALIEIAITCDIPCVREEMVNSLIKIFDKHLANQLEFFVDCKPLFGMTEAKELLVKITSANMPGSDQDTLYDCYCELTQKQPGLVGEEKLVQMMATVSTVNGKKFIKSRSGDLKIMQQIWSTFFDPDSKHFSKELFHGCFSDLLVAMRDLMLKLKDDREQLMSLLTFLSSARVPAKKIFGQKGIKTWFLFDLMPELMQLTDDSRAEIRKQVKSMLSTINASLTSVLSK